MNVCCNFVSQRNLNNKLLNVVSGATRGEKGTGREPKPAESLRVTNFHERSLVSYWFNWQGKERCWQRNGDAVRGGNPHG